MCSRSTLPGAEIATGTVSRLNTGVEMEAHRASLGHSHLSEEELQRLRRMLDLLQLIVSAGSWTSRSTAMIVFATIVLEVSLSVPPHMMFGTL